MAASTKSVRVKLAFDNLVNLKDVVPPKAWYLVDFKCLDTIADLERDVVAKYALNWVKSVDFYVEGCLLPKWESIRLVHENDVLKLEASALKTRKRKQSKEATPSKRSRVEKVGIEAGDGKRTQAQAPPSSSSSSSESESEDEVPKVKKTESKKPTKTPQSSSGDSDSDDEQQANIHAAAATPTPNTRNVTETNPEPTSKEQEDNKTPRRNRRRVRKRKNNAGNSTMKDQNLTANTTNGFETPNAWPVSNGSYNSPRVSQTVHSSGHIKFDDEEVENEDCKVVTSDPSESPMTTGTVEQSNEPATDQEVVEQEQNVDDSWKQAMQALAEQSSFKPRQLKNNLVAGAKVFTRESRYKHKKDPNFSFSKAEQLSSVATNRSFFFKNQESAKQSTEECSEESPQAMPSKKSESPATKATKATDYSSYPALHHMPNNGQIIAYKIVEMSENYCPLVSEYKEAKVLDVNLGLKKVTLEIIKDAKKTRDQPGKFDIPDQMDMEEDNRVSVTWSSLIDVKLVSA